MLYTNQRRNEMAKRKGLTDEAARDEMVVLLEGMPEEDIDATLSEDDESETVDEAMSAAEPVGGDLVSDLKALVDQWQPETDEGIQYDQQVRELISSYES